MVRIAKNPESFVSVGLRCCARIWQRSIQLSLDAVFFLVIACLAISCANENLAKAADDQDSKAAVANDETREESSRSRPVALKFRILRRKNGEPVADAKVPIQMWDNSKNVSPTLTTDADGRATFEYADVTAIPIENQWFNREIIGKIEKPFEVTKDQSTLDLGTIQGVWNQKPEKATP